jgi:hypothetical protein
MLTVAVLAAVLSGGPAPATSVAPKAPKADRTSVTSVLAAATASARVPGFSRQTRLACGVCHYGFPQLTAFGRLFKLNGYTMSGLTPITAQADSTSRVSLTLSPIAPLSVMAIADRKSVV